MGKYETILITGGAGFIGSNFIHNIIDENIQIINYDKLTYAGNLNNLSNIEGRDNYIFIKGDICDYQSINNVINKYKPQAIINFAAETHVDRSIIGSADFIMTNIEGTRVLLECSKANDIERFIQISTDEVYGDLYDSNEEKFRTDTPLKPSSPYSSTKAAADMLVMSYRRTYDMPVLITRCSNNYGPYQFPEKLIPLVIYKAINNERIPVYGDGKNIRDWIYVSDHNRAVKQVLEQGIDGSIYNIGADNEMENLALIYYILDAMGKDRELIEFVEDRRGHDRHYAIDNSEIEKQLGFTTQTSFESGMKKTIDWYLDNKEWTKRCINKEYLEYYSRNYLHEDNI